MDIATGEKENTLKVDLEAVRAAVSALSGLGGLKGSKERAAALTPEERTEIAKKAARKRWYKGNSISPT